MLLIGVVPSFLNSVPLVMLVILKKATSLPSAALRLMTRPVVVCVSSFVDELVTEGVSAIGVTGKLTLPTSVFGSETRLVVPLSCTV